MRIGPQKFRLSVVVVQAISSHQNTAPRSGQRDVWDSEFELVRQGSEVVKKLPGTVPILPSLQSKMGLSPSPWQFFHHLSAYDNRIDARRGQDLQSRDCSLRRAALASRGSGGCLGNQE